MTALPIERDFLLARIVQGLQHAMAEYAPERVALIAEATLTLTRNTDPVNQQFAYGGIWRDANQARCGMLTLNSDGSFYAEFDVFCPHPRDASRWIEMLTAWGNAHTWHCEATWQPALN